MRYSTIISLLLVLTTSALAFRIYIPELLPPYEENGPGPNWRDSPREKCLDVDVYPDRLNPFCMCLCNVRCDMYCIAKGMKEELASRERVWEEKARTCGHNATVKTTPGEVVVTSEDRVKVSEERAKASEEKARAAEEKAKSSEFKAKVSEEMAKASEERTKASEERAKASEEKAKALFEAKASE